MGLRIDQRIVIVVRKTRQQELTAKYGTLGQAKFMVSRSRAAHAGLRKAVAAGASLRDLAQAPAAQQRELLAEIATAESLEEQAAGVELRLMEQQSATYDEVVAGLRRELDFDIPVQVVDRAYVPKMVFGPKDVVVAVGQDGLVANVAKYAVGLPIVGVNPDPEQYDGVLLPFGRREAPGAVQRALEGRAKIRQVTLAEARLNDGQRLLAFNDLFIGARSHVSARYRLETPAGEERQSSSGIIVSTGAGSTGWLSSVMNMARGVAGWRGRSEANGAQAASQRRRVRAQQEIAPMVVARGVAVEELRMEWEDRKLAYVVREPFTSKVSAASIVMGMVGAGEALTVESLMGPEGTIFSDGVEMDFMPFAEGMIATVGVAKETARLVVG